MSRLRSSSAAAQTSSCSRPARGHRGIRGNTERAAQRIVRDLIESGFVQKEILESAYRSARAQEDRQEIVVGVNAFRTSEEPIAGILRIDPEMERTQIARVQELRKRRDSRKAQDALHAVEEAVDRGDSIMDPLVEALDVLVTLGEVSDILRKRFGEFRETTVL